jgi:hypothetical protein
MSTEETKDTSPQNEHVDHDEISKGNTPTEHTEDDEHRVDTVVPDNDSGIPGPPSEKDSSNKDGGPSEENL